MRTALKLVWEVSPQGGSVLAPGFLRCYAHLSPYSWWVSRSVRGAFKLILAPLGRTAVLQAFLSAKQREIHREQRSLCELISWGDRSETLLFFEWSCRPWINKQLLIFVDQLEGNPPNSDHLLLEWHPFFSHAKGWTFIRGWQHVGHGVDRSENPCFGPWEQEYSAFRCYRIDIHLYIYIYVIYIYICYIYIYVIYIYICIICIYVLYIYICIIYICYIYMLYIYMLYIYICYIYIYMLCIYICYIM